MSLIEVLRSRNAKAISTSIGYRNRDSKESFRPVDVTDLIRDDLQETSADLLEALACKGQVDLKSESADLDSVGVDRVFTGADIAGAISQTNKVDCKIPATDRERLLLMADLLKRKASAAKADKPIKPIKATVAPKPETETVRV